MNIFLNHDEGRLRAGWRLAGQFFLLMLIALSANVLLDAIFNFSDGLIFGLSMTVGAILSTIAAAYGLDKRAWNEYGINFNHKWLKHCGLGFALAGAVMGLIFLIEYTAGWVTVTGYGWERTTETSYFWAFASYFLFMILVGFWEELVFRGYQILNLAEGFNGDSISRRQAVIAAAVLSSLLFGVLHAGNPNASWISTLNIAIAGGMLAFPFLITGRLSYSIGLHIGWNFFQGGIFGFGVSGTLNRASLIQINQTGPELITRGVFGPEAGLLGLLGMCLVVGGFIFYFKRSGYQFAIFPDFGLYKPFQYNQSI